MDPVPKKYWTASSGRSRLTRQTRREFEADGTGKTLKIEVRSVGVRISGALRAKVLRRVLLALSRFGPRIRKVTVRLGEPANVLGSVDQRCRMRVWLQDKGDIRVETINGTIEAAVARASALLVKRVDRAMDDDPVRLRRRPTPRPRRRARG